MHGCSGGRRVEGERTEGRGERVRSTISTAADNAQLMILIAVTLCITLLSSV
jgi:hypothetical protein